MNFIVFSTVLVFDESIVDWANPASTIRGIWGRVLKKIYCIQKAIQCSECSMPSCSYFNLFEKQYSTAEQYHPYIISLKHIENNVAVIEFKFMGWAATHQARLLQSILGLSTYPVLINGIKHDFQILKIEDIKDNTIYSLDSRIVHKPFVENLSYKPFTLERNTLRFVTPLRQKSEHSLMSNFQWEPFIKSLITRIRFIDKYFNNDELCIPKMIDISTVKVVKSNMRWEEAFRKSLRQNDKMSLGGLIGEVELRGLTPDLNAILLLGSYLHTGKQTTFGNGKYILNYDSSMDNI